MTVPNLRDPTSWYLDAEHRSTTLVSYEPTGNGAAFLSIYRITNAGPVDVAVTTAQGIQIALAADAAIDICSERINIAFQAAATLGVHTGGTYQLLCCSVGQSMGGGSAG